MTRSSLWIVMAGLALLLATAAVVAHFVIPSPAKVDGATRAEVDALRAELSAAEKRGGEAPRLKVGFISVVSASEVFLDAVKDVSQRSTAKAQEIADLQASYGEGTVDAGEYQKRHGVLNAEWVEVNISVYTTILDRMMASASFSDLRSTLKKVREQAQPLADSARNFVATVKGGAASSGDLQARLSQLQSGYSQLEKIVNQVCGVKIQQAARKVAIAQGFDLVLMRDDVVLYPPAAGSTDLTEAVKSEIAGYL